ncbi:MAG: NADAR family protein [Acutalibacteraceae bacterium]
MEVVCFHNPNEINGYLSNWYKSEFEKDGQKYTSMEQYMMYQKAVTFNDTQTAQKILQTSDPSKIKAFGREVKGFDNVIWNGMRQIIVYEGLLAKFSQNAVLKNQLLATGNDMMAECAVQDRIWGIGLSMNDPKRFDMKEWKGQNLLGFALMSVRKALAQSR